MSINSLSGLDENFNLMPQNSNSEESIDDVIQKVDSYSFDQIRNLAKSFVEKENFFKESKDFKFYELFEKIIKQKDSDRSKVVTLYNDLVGIDPKQKFFKEMLYLIIKQVKGRNGLRGVKRPSEDPIDFKKSPSKKARKE